MIVDLEGVSLCYRLARQRVPSIKEYAIHWIRGGVRYEKFWALREISLTVEAGETVGIIGHNGAGKSSLLKVISGILDPTEGRSSVHGRIAPILELGTGFDPDLTGLENVRLNALLLGHSKAEIRERLDEILAFADLGQFVESPVRAYSSGMLARLGFAIATAWPADLLILDEVMAVGDIAFIRKCEQRIGDLQRGGTSLLFVTHDPQLMLEACRRCIWLDHGRIAADGPTPEIIERYIRAMAAPTEPTTPPATFGPAPAPAAG